MNCIFKNFFRRPDYIFEHTLFLNELHRKNPNLAAQQREGRALLWDKQNCFDYLKEYQSQNMPHPDYKYYSIKNIVFVRFFCYLFNLSTLIL